MPSLSGVALRKAAMDQMYDRVKVKGSKVPDAWKPIITALQSTACSFEEAVVNAANTENGIVVAA